MFRRHYIKDLSSYLDNQLPDTKRATIEKHLESCSFCSQELSRLKVLSSRLREWQAPVPSRDFESSVENEIVRREVEGSAVKMKKKTLAILVPSGALVTIVAMVFLGQLFVQRGFRGSLKESVDNVGYQFNPEQEARRYKDMGINQGEAQDNYGSIASFEAADGYEPYYLRGGAYEKADATGPEREAWHRISRGETVEYAQGTGYANKALLPSSVPAPEPGGPIVVVQPVIPATSEGEKVIRTGEIRLEVVNGRETYKKASGICQELGGYIADSQFYKDEEGRESGKITMRIPKDNFLDALDKLGTLGTLEGSTTHSQDISQEHRNLTQELEITMVVYNKMIEEFKKRQVTIPQAMRLESEITPVLRKIEMLKNKLEYLDNAVSFTTVSVYFHEPLVSVKVLQQTKVMVKEKMLASTIATIKFVVGNLPVIVLLLVVAAVAIAVLATIGKWISRISKHE